jgi:hypothetical protein
MSKPKKQNQQNNPGQNFSGLDWNSIIQPSMRLNQALRKKDLKKMEISFEDGITRIVLHVQIEQKVVQMGVPEYRAYRELKNAENTFNIRLESLNKRIKSRQELRGLELKADCMETLDTFIEHLNPEIRKLLMMTEKGYKSFRVQQKATQPSAERANADAQKASA